jgi:hypothetical protein
VIFPTLMVKQPSECRRNIPMPYRRRRVHTPRRYSCESVHRIHWMIRGMGPFRLSSMTSRRYLCRLSRIAAAHILRFLPYASCLIYYRRARHPCQRSLPDSCGADALPALSHRPGGRVSLLGGAVVRLAPWRPSACLGACGREHRETTMTPDTTRLLVAINQEPIWARQNRATL